MPSRGVCVCVCVCVLGGTGSSWVDGTALFLFFFSLLFHEIETEEEAKEKP